MAGEMITRLQEIVQDRKANPQEGSYTNKLFDAGIERIAQKVGEEAIEVVIAALSEDNTVLLGELADLIYHMTVLLAARDEKWEHLEGVLEARHVLAKERK